MKNNWRITKYNPKFRNETGEYMIDEWTSITDVISDGNKAGISNYFEVEKNYINAILSILDELNIGKLKIIECEKNGEYNFDCLISDEENNELKNMYDEINDEFIVDKNQIAKVSKLVLREKLWFKLIDDEKVYIHFGHDYYMYIGCNESCDNALETISRNELYIENVISPYVE